MRARITHNQSVAIGRRLSRGIGADAATCADSIVDDDRHSPNGVKLGSDHARHDVPSITCSARHDKPDGLNRVRLGHGSHHREEQNCGDGEADFFVNCHV